MRVLFEVIDLNKLPRGRAPRYSARLIKKVEYPINSFLNYFKLMKLNWLDIIALVLVIVGGLNWGMVGVLNYDLVGQATSGIPEAGKVAYALVGLAAIYLAIIAPKLERK